MTPSKKEIDHKESIKLLTEMCELIVDKYSDAVTVKAAIFLILSLSRQQKDAKGALKDTIAILQKVLDEDF